jgi:hypothetical protein
MPPINEVPDTQHNTCLPGHSTFFFRPEVIPVVAEQVAFAPREGNIA